MLASTTQLNDFFPYFRGYITNILFSLIDIMDIINKTFHLSGGLQPLSSPKSTHAYILWKQDENIGHTLLLFLVCIRVQPNGGR